MWLEDLKFFYYAPTYRVNRAPRSALGNDQHDIATKRQTVDPTTENWLFSMQEKYPTKELV
jgi:hypothetical protein